jgi:transketolase
VALTKERLGWPRDASFLVPVEALAHLRQSLDQGRAREAAWNEVLAAYRQAHPDLAVDLQHAMAGELPPGWQEALPVFPADPKGMATRVAGGKALNALALRVPTLLGGSADLNPSTHTALAGLGDFQDPGLSVPDRQGAVGPVWSYAGRNIHFGVREHGMAAVMNGMAAHGGVIPFGATFLPFADYLRPSLRLAALMGLHLVQVFTHDSIAVGEDGPTHQPVEQIASLRLIPKLVVIRPCDANETAVAWRVALEQKDRPVALILSRQNLPTIDRASHAPADGLERGGYILAEADGGPPQLILVATGSEVQLALAARQQLATEGVRARVVSLPSWELFDEQPEEYRRAVLPPEITKRLAIEAGATMGWERYVGGEGGVMGVDRFGASAPGDVMLHQYGFTAEEVCRRAKALLRLPARC